MVTHINKKINDNTCKCDVKLTPVEEEENVSL